ncbi:FKBP-type peptidylprolyl isomerase [Flavobacterium rhamnosiphilum]|uniref:FKBP-type peptidylprolyl isomerase n=1 Tax=Flavobacterium rhamnosiphilum TaxID=2541724 RepID=A0A4V2Z8V4_9FLAO|nr:FKBP-type peptidylprolyl isomerase [Flavobacterium rhamnosiphilum]TDE41803.1 FKBP-type peptidylprolyl isomerase [Flavobacterium rhamnosiphilum]
MNKFKYYFILSITTFSLFSCSKDNDAAEITPPRDYAVQYATDLADIEEYLKTYYIEDVSPDVDTKIVKIPTGGNQPSIWSYKDNAVQGGTTFPQLWSREVKLHNITYKLYYLVLREGIGESPSNVDGMLVSYRGDYLTSKTEANVITLTTTQFTDVKYPNGFVDLYGYLRGWKEIIPQFKSGTYDSNVDGTISYKDFGAGVMFIPSGLAYFSSGQGTIPAYAPLVFNFKLYEIQRLDHEFVFSGQSIVPIPDGVKSFQEDLDGDGYMWTKAELPDGVINPDDSDGDGIPNFLDVDDDGDGVSTKKEITGANGILIPFADIPSCDGNTTDPARVKRHLVKCN